MNALEKVKAMINHIEFLTPAEKEVIIKETIFEEFPKDTFLLKEGQIPKRCFMVVEGCVREYIIINGEEKTTGFYTEGDKITPYNTVEVDQPSKHYLECLEDCILTISNKSFENHLRKLLPRLDQVIQGFAKEEIGRAKTAWTKFISSSPEERYTHLMETRPALFNRVNHHQIASYLGMKPQSLSRIRKRVWSKELNGQATD
ncbi:Crp/Fnr family transcriptional regulator [Roseivirga sp.]|uniref:Crp/Fnr family transcriptional regulator n=1 Tax=Roseivirga sp. TaxID=1964215 RepID=UPI003B51E36A